MQKFLKAAWERVVLSYKSTLVGLGIGVGLILLDSLTDYLQALPQGWAKAAAVLVIAVSASLRSKALPPAQPTPSP